MSLARSLCAVAATALSIAAVDASVWRITVDLEQSGITSGLYSELRCQPVVLEMLFDPFAAPTSAATGILSWDQSSGFVRAVQLITDESDCATFGRDLEAIGGDAMISDDRSEPSGTFEGINVLLYDASGTAIAEITLSVTSFIPISSFVDGFSIDEPLGAIDISPFANAGEAGVRLLGELPGEQTLGTIRSIEVMESLSVLDCLQPGDVTTTNTNPGDPCYGRPDGTVDGADLSYSVELWLGSVGSSCP